MSETPILEFNNVNYSVPSQDIGRHLVEDLNCHITVDEDSEDLDLDMTPILKNINWQVKRGEHWVILGPNGAGKTSLLKLACGYLWPNRGGEILRLGESLVDLRKLRSSIGWVSHRLAREIPPHEKVLKTVVSGRLGQVGLNEDMTHVKLTADDYALGENWLSKLSGHALIDKRFGMLSQGEQQKTLIARAMMALPLIVFLDEPCAGLDPGAREQFLASMSQLLSGKMADGNGSEGSGHSDMPGLVMVTHHLEEVMPQFDHLLVIKNGAIEVQGRTRELINSDLYGRIYERPIQDMISRDGRFWPIF